MRDLYLKTVENPSVQTICDIEDFKFPDSMLYNSRMREREIERLYYRNSTYILAYFNNEIVGTIKVVEKRTPKDRIPLDYAGTESGTPILTFENQYPYCEVAGFKVSESLPSIVKYNAIYDLLNTTFEYIISRKFWCAYATTKKSNIRLYEKWMFQTVGPVHYGFEEYTAMKRSIYYECIVGKERTMKLVTDSPHILLSQERPNA